MPSKHVNCNCWICKRDGYFIYEGNTKVVKFPDPNEVVIEQKTLYRCGCGYETEEKNSMKQHLKTHPEPIRV